MLESRRERSGHNYLYYFLAAFIGFIVFMLQSSFTVLPAIWSVYPVPLIPFVVCVAFLNKEKAGFFTGLGCGLLMDSVSTRSVGFHTIMLTLAGVVIGLLAEFLFNNRMLSCVMLCMFTCALYFTLYWLIFVVFEDGVGASYYFYRYTVFQAVYSWLFVFFIYPLLRFVLERFRK